MIRICGRKSLGRQNVLRTIILGVGLIAGCSAAALAADTITGVVRNQTRGRLAGGDEVILLRLDQSMQEEARTRTDSQGSFTLTVRYPAKLHLVRVVHQGVNYDQRISAGDAVSIDVFDAAAKVQGITGSIEIIRTGTNGKLLHVSDMIEIKNDSNPPLTQAGERTFEVYLPTHARIDSVLAAGSEKMGVLISASAVPGEPGYYTVNFPLRPGSTKFAFNYDLPYEGHARFRSNRVYPLQQLAVMIPPTMKFASSSPAFQVLATGNDSYQVEVANQVEAGAGPEFEVSGAGALPPIKAGAQSKAQSQAGLLSRPAVSAPVSPQVPASARRDPTPASSSSSLRWWVFGVGGVILLGGCGFLMRRTRGFTWPRMKGKAASQTRQSAPLPSSFLEVLKEEFLELEIARRDGSISGAEYDAAKLALEGTVKRALTRKVSTSV